MKHVLGSQVEAAEAALAFAEERLAEVERKHATANVIQKIWGKYPSRKKAAEEKVAVRRQELRQAQQYKQRQESLPWVRVISHLTETNQRFKQLPAPSPQASAPQPSPVHTQDQHQSQRQHNRQQQQQQQQQQEIRNIPEVPGPSAPSMTEMWQDPTPQPHLQAPHDGQKSWQERFADDIQPDHQPAGFSVASGSETAGSSDACCICFDGELDCGLIPCGHRVCRECGPPLVTGLCPLCRGQVTAVLTLY